MNNILIMTNMGPYKGNSYSGRFVFNQYQYILKDLNNNYSLFFMSPNGTGKVFNLVKYVIYLFRFIQFSFSNRRFDLLHVHYYYPTIFFAVLYKFLFNSNVKIIVTFHGSDVFNYRVAPFLYKYLYNFVDHSFFVSKGLKKKFSLSCNNEDYSILSAGVLPLLRDDYCAVYDKIYDLCIIGTINRNKRVSEFINLISSYSKRRLKIVIVGGGDLRELNSSINISGHDVSYLGEKEISEIKEIYLSSHFTISCSIVESFGLTISESLSLGTPVIATKTDGSIEQIEDGKNGFIFDFSQEGLNSVLTKAFEMSVSDYKVMSSFSISSSEKYKISNVASEIIKKYDSVLSH